jgi:hemerythrin superfamily protein
LRRRTQGEQRHAAACCLPIPEENPDMPQVPTASAHGSALGRLATGAALGLFAGLALPQARKAVVQAPSLAAGDWVDGLTAEHRMVQKHFETLLATRHDETARREILMGKIASALTKHAVEEENVIYPALTEGGHADQARHLIEDHGLMKTHLYDLRRLSARDLEWIGRARQLWNALEKHMREEEQTIFPAFRDALSAEENAKLTKMIHWEGFKVA